MAKVHPNVAVQEQPSPSSSTIIASGEEELLTVWRKSLLFNCHGFTVFDSKGNLAFRLDSYSSSSSSTWSSSRHADLLLMDAAGNPLLTIRRKRMTIALSDQWIIYHGDSSTPLLSVRRRRRASKGAIAHVTPMSSSLAMPEEGYVVEGSYGRRSCAVRDARGEAVAAVSRKDSVGDDVFRLVVKSQQLGAALGMGILIAIDEMFRGGNTSLLRRTCSA
uniref:Protein LURP-one-related 8 n=1 Tax=Leersia perrieri TaxID=77586 RepID=A0A0D9XNI2_9ORYZ